MPDGVMRGTPIAADGGVKREVDGLSPFVDDANYHTNVTVTQHFQCLALTFLNTDGLRRIKISMYYKFCLLALQF